MSASGHAPGRASRVYADYAAWAPLRSCARGAMALALAEAGNPSSTHGAGGRARALLEDAREQIAAAIGAHPLEVVFTSSATEANNLALLGVAAAWGRPRHVAVPASEHSSVLAPARTLAAAGHRVSILPVGDDGRTPLDTIREAAPDLLSVGLVNAETGILQDCGALAAAAHALGAVTHVDAAQAAGTIDIDVRTLPADLLTLSSAKVGGPPGAGALYVRTGTPLAAQLHGGPQERGLRAGSENVPAIAGFAAALAAAVAERRGEVERLGDLRLQLRAGIAALEPRARFAGEGAGALATMTGILSPHVVNMTFPGRRGEDVVAALDLEGIAVSAGSACAAGAVEPSHVLLAMGRSREEAASAVRISLGWASTAADVAAILAALTTILARTRAPDLEAACPAPVS